MSTPARLPEPTTLPSLSTPEQTQALDLLFEPSPAIHSLLLPVLKTPFPTYDALIDSAHVAFLTLASSTDKTVLHSILGSHPRLGAKKVESAQSAAEQAQLAAGAAQLAALNEEYEARFPGLRYVVFVNGRGKDVVMADMRRRIERGDAAAEEKEAIRVRGTAAPGCWCGRLTCYRPCAILPRTGRRSCSSRGAEQSYPAFADISRRAAPGHSQASRLAIQAPTSGYALRRTNAWVFHCALWLPSIAVYTAYTSVLAHAHSDPDALYGYCFPRGPPKRNAD